jgi:energy-coupling factor transporter ATP-binding protein EcfA2
VQSIATIPFSQVSEGEKGTQDAQRQGHFRARQFSRPGENVSALKRPPTVEPNQIVALIGPTGPENKPGQYDLLTMSRWQRADRWRRRARNGPAELRRQIGIVLQTSLFSVSVKENIAFGRLQLPG